MRRRGEVEQVLGRELGGSALDEGIRAAHRDVADELNDDFDHAGAGVAERVEGQLDTAPLSDDDVREVAEEDVAGRQGAVDVDEVTVDSVVLAEEPGAVLTLRDTLEGRLVRRTHDELEVAVHLETFHLRGEPEHIRPSTSVRPKLSTGP